MMTKNKVILGGVAVVALGAVFLWGNGMVGDLASVVIGKGRTRAIPATTTIPSTTVEMTTEASASTESETTSAPTIRLTGASVPVPTNSGGIRSSGSSMPTTSPIVDFDSLIDSSQCSQYHVGERSVKDDRAKQKEVCGITLYEPGKSYQETDYKFLKNTLSNAVVAEVITRDFLKQYGPIRQVKKVLTYSELQGAGVPKPVYGHYLEKSIQEISDALGIHPLCISQVGDDLHIVSYEQNTLWRNLNYTYSTTSQCNSAFFSLEKKSCSLTHVHKSGDDEASMLKKLYDHYNPPRVRLSGKAVPVSFTDLSSDCDEIESIDMASYLK